MSCHVSWAEHAASHIIIVGDYGSVNDVEYIDMREGAWAVDSTSGMSAGQINNLCGSILYTDKHKVMFSSQHCS